MLIETLAGCSKDEIIKDYMTTYLNYYDISEEETKEKYDTIVNLYLSDMFKYLCNEPIVENVTDEMLFNGVVKYLNDVNVSDDEINNIISIITE